MSEFEEYWNDGFNSYDDAKDAAKDTWDHQQAKIDAITKQRDSFIKALHIAMNDVCEHKAKIDELQARINEALRYVVDHGGYDDLTHVINILKGNKDEN